MINIKTQQDNCVNRAVVTTCLPAYEEAQSNNKYTGCKQKGGGRERERERERERKREW